MKTGTPSDRWPWLLGIALGGLVLGAAFYGLGMPGATTWAWAGATAVSLVATSAASARRLRHGEAGVDVIAILAMAGALALGENLAGVLIAVMLTGGQALEGYALERARGELEALLARAPRFATRRVGSELETVDVNAVQPGDELVVKPGEVIPTDGQVGPMGALLDESALTGEARPVEVAPGALVRSGSTNVGWAFDLRATTPAAESTYAGIIRLVEAAGRSKAPAVRLADSYAGYFVVLTLVLVAGTWLLTRDPVRALAVLVVATPCPLILAVPVAIFAGISRAARHGIIVKGGGPLETLARVTTLLLDKTGTVTAGRPRVLAVESFGQFSGDQLLGLTASLEQVSTHPFAPAIIAEARNREIRLALPTDAREQMGAGLAGQVEAHRVAVGQVSWLSPRGPLPPAVQAVARRTVLEGSSSVYVMVDDRLEGALLLDDPLRTEAARTLQALRDHGVRRIYMVTGDHPDVAELVGDALGLDRVFAERTPEEKVDVVKQVRQEGVTVMVGDGVNDAPALALADVGVAMGARGATAAAESAGVVLAKDRLDGLLEAVGIARRTRQIALQSVLAGMGLSAVAMLAAAAGYLTPVAGAVLQEAIDALVILNALRALGGKRAPAGATGALAAKLGRAHRTLRPRIDELAVLASRLDSLPPPEAREALAGVQQMLETELLPHERQEQQEAFPALAHLLPGEDPTQPLVGTHRALSRLARLYGRLVASLPPEGPGPADLHDFQRALYGLHAILTLHFDQEDELYSLLEEKAAP